MKFREIFRFEVIYQVRRISTWLPFVVLIVAAFFLVRANYISDANSGDFFLNAPFVITSVTIYCSLFWFLIAAGVAGEAAARDVETRMHPLIYTAPVSKAEYQGGRFLAAFVLNALTLLAVPVGILLAVHSPGVDAEILGPALPAAYLSAYFFIALPNAFVGTAVQFAWAARSRRAIVSYLGSALFFFTTLIVAAVVGDLVHTELGELLDLIGVITIENITDEWTLIEKNTRLIALEGMLLWNRLLWLGIALAALAFTYLRFRFVHPTASSWRRLITRRREVHLPTSANIGAARSTAISVPQVRRTFGFATRARQTGAIAWTSFGKIAKGRSGLVLLTVVAMFVIVLVAGSLESVGVRMLPRADYVLRLLITPPLIGHWLIPLLIVYWAGELIWREREARLSEITDAVPVPEWVLLLGKFLGLGLVLVVWMALLMIAGLFVQVGSDYPADLEIGLFLQVLFGIRLADYLFLAVLALVVHVVVNQKHLGHIVSLTTYGLIVFSPQLGIEHKLLIYGSDPGWSYTEMNGFGMSLWPWLWFKLYWVAWALLLAVVAKLLWVRSREGSFGARLQLVRRRFTRRTAAVATAAVALIFTFGGFIFYNTNILNEYETASESIERSAEYERRYGRYEDIPQPRLTGVNMQVEIYPDRREVEISGSYRLVNRNAVPIDSIHLATVSDVETRAVAFDRPAAEVLADEDLGHRIYALEEPLQPGDSLGLSFELRFAPRGFRNSGADASVVANGTYFWNHDWLPAIGYQADRELSEAGERRAHGLAPRPEIPSLYDVEARQYRDDADRIAFEAVVGTAEDQVAVAPGALRRTWMEGGRRYFHYATSAPIQNQYAFLSAAYVVHEGQWQHPSAGSGRAVAIRIFHHPGHIANLNRILQSVQASLSYYTERFGPYPYSHISLVEHPGHSIGMHAESSLITFQEGFSLLNPDGNPSSFDLPFFVVAHEVAHQWWGAQLAPASVEGAGLLSEGLAQYSAMRVVEETYGHEHLRRALSSVRETHQIPSSRATPPLLRATDPVLYYGKGSLALYALSEYIGKERVHDTFRRLLETHRSGAPPLPTTLDLYRELQTVTPDSLQYLLHDLFAANTFWEMETEAVRAEPTDAGTWQVALDVRVRKVVVDSMGVETEVPVDDWAEIGVFAPTEEGEERGETLYLQKHRISSTEQTITVTVPRRPAQAGIDPDHLLIDLEMEDNVGRITDGEELL
jgi:ABC-2 type transport system permease protein